MEVLPARLRAVHPRNGEPPPDSNAGALSQPLRCGRHDPFAVHLKSGGPYWSNVTLESTVELFHPDVPSSIQRVQILLPGCHEVIIESVANE